MGVWVIVECLPSNAWGPGFHPRYCNNNNNKKDRAGRWQERKRQGPWN